MQAGQFTFTGHPGSVGKYSTTTTITYTRIDEQYGIEKAVNTMSNQLSASAGIKTMFHPADHLL